MYSLTASFWSPALLSLLSPDASGSCPPPKTPRNENLWKSTSTSPRMLNTKDPHTAIPLATHIHYHATPTITSFPWLLQPRGETGPRPSHSKQSRSMRRIHPSHRLLRIQTMGPWHQKCTQTVRFKRARHVVANESWPCLFLFCRSGRRPLMRWSLSGLKARRRASCILDHVAYIPVSQKISKYAEIQS